MPRDGAGIYTQPFPDVVPDTTIESAVYNGFVADVVQDLNTPRPIIAGGTGADDAEEAMANLKGEIAAYAVTNYDMHVWYPGSFRAAGGATGGPVDGHAFAGIVYLNEPLTYPPTNQNVIIEARDLTTGLRYSRVKTAGVWGAWTAEASAADVAAKVAKAGDTMSGDLTIAKALPHLILNRTDDNPAAVSAQKAGLYRWSLHLGTNDAEAGANAGSNLVLYRYDDAGAVIGGTAVLAINRATGLMTVNASLTTTGPVTLPGNPTLALQAVPKQYVDLKFSRVVIQAFSASGTWVPQATMLYATLEVVGGGGGGGAALGVAGFSSGAGGGGSGGYARRVITKATAGAGLAVAIGAGGAGTNPGGTGGTTSIGGGGLCAASGGTGGTGANGYSQIPVSGSNGSPVAGDTGLYGGPGHNGFLFAGANLLLGGGQGANSVWGMGGRGGFGGYNSTSAGGAGIYGGGGGGAYTQEAATQNPAGGVGGGGLAIITEYCA